jgi:single-strand DNA-binding protein
MPNEAQFTVTGYVATKPFLSETRTGLPTLSMRVGWTPRRIDRATGEWTDGPTCFVSVKCFGRMAQNAKASLDKGDPVLVTGTLRMHDYQSKEGVLRTSVDITATALGHDLSRGITNYMRVRPKTERADEESRDGHDGAAGEPGLAGPADEPDEPGLAGPADEPDGPPFDAAGLAAGETVGLAGDGPGSAHDGGPAEDVDAEAARLIEQAGDPVPAPF